MKKKLHGGKFWLTYQPLRTLTVCLFFLTSITLKAQQISGTVSDNNGSGIPGVLIQVKGTSTGSVTDLDGKYTISAKGADTLIFSSVGLETLEEVVGNRTQISVTMEEAVMELGEVVLTALGIKK